MRAIGSKSTRAGEEGVFEVVRDNPVAAFGMRPISGVHPELTLVDRDLHLTTWVQKRCWLGEQFRVLTNTENGASQDWA